MTIWHRRPTAAELDALHEGTAIGHLGIRITEVGDDFIAGTMPVDDRTKQPLGLLHGGASVLLAETLGSAASACCVDMETHFTVGLEVNANHIGGAREGSVLGVCRPVHLGRSTHVWDIRITQGERLISACRLTASVLQRKQPGA